MLVTFKPREFLLLLSPDEERNEEFLSKVILTENWEKLDRGGLSLEQGRKGFEAELPEYRDLLKLFFDQMFKMFAPIEGNISVLRELKANNYKVFALSNFIKEMFDYVRNEFDFFELFDGWVISFQEHALKPEEAIYRTLFHRFKLMPNECVFLDDVPSFLEPAQRLGMHTILVGQKSNVREDLRDFGVKIKKS